MNIKNPLHSQLPELVDKKENITRIENNRNNLTLKTLYDIVEMGFGGKYWNESRILIMHERYN